MPQKQSCFSKTLGCLLNENRVCALLGIDPQQLHDNQEAEKQQYILKCNSVGEIINNSLLYDIPGKLQFDYKAFCPL